jgi:beta-N-acetylhexosaminidase
MADRRRALGAAIIATLFIALAASTSMGAPRGEAGWVARTLAAMSLEEKVGQMFVTYAYGESVADPSPDMIALNQQDHGVDNMQQLIERYHLGGVIYFAWSNNVNYPQQIAGLSNGVQDVATGSGAGIPALVSTDQEGGIVARVLEPATQFPGNMALGAARKASAARTAAKITGEELRAIGINQNFAPVADVNVDPRNPVIGVRSYSSRASLVSELTAAQVTGYRVEGIAATAKHFPGHGDTDVDSHTGLPVIDHTREELESIDLPPFQAAIDAGVDSIMTAHIVVPALDPSGRPATLSEPILTGLLRDEMGYRGVIVTDALTMEGVREMFGDERVPIEAIKAGADQLLMPPDIDLAYNSVLDAVRSGEITESRIDASVERILRLKEQLGLFEDPFVDEAAVSSVVGTEKHLKEADKITDRTITLVANDAGLLPLAAGSVSDVFVTGWGVSTTATLASFVSERGPATSVLETGADPSDARIQAAVTEAQGSDLTLVTTMRAPTSEGQQKLVGALVDTGVPVVVISVREPYDIAYLPDAQTYLATYGFKSVSLASVTEVMFGETRPQGRLPVDIPTAEDPNEILYQFGHGLGY